MDNNKELVGSIIKCSIQLSKKHHDENMNNKIHSIHCIIHKNIHKYMQPNQNEAINDNNNYNINNNNNNTNNNNNNNNNNNDAIVGRYACDFLYDNMSSRMYMQFLNAKCGYYNVNYIQYEEQAINDLTREFILA
jgi:hypothetical protein